MSVKKERSSVTLDLNMQAKKLRSSHKSNGYSGGGDPATPATVVAASRKESSSAGDMGSEASAVSPGSPGTAESVGGSKANGTLRDLYRFADCVDYQLMSIGLLLALVQAILPPFVWLVMGDFVSYAIQREEVKLNGTQALDRMTSGQTADSPANNTLDDLFVDRQSVIDHKFDESATPVFIAMLALSCGTFIAAFIQRLCWEFSGIRQVFRARKLYIRKLLHMDIAWLESKHSAQVASMLHDQADSIYQGIADHFPMALFISCYMAVTLCVCFYIQWDVTLVMLTTLPVLIGTRIIFSRWFSKTMNAEIKIQGKISNLVQETFMGIRTVIAFAAQKQTLFEYEKLSNDHYRMTEERLRASSVYDSLAQVLFTELIFTGALCYGVWRVGSNNPGRLGALAINFLYMCVTSISIGFHFNGVSAARQNAHEMESILDEAPTIETQYCRVAKRRFRRSKIGTSSTHRKLSDDSENASGRGAVSFQHVSFSYPSRPDVEVIHDMSFDVAPGEHLAVVGLSGSGKSTLTALMLRFYDPNVGKILLDGEDIRSMNPDEMRSQIGLVSQEPVLFDGTIADNIRYGRLGATQGDVNDAARRAEAWTFISALPDGMRTRVGDRFFFNCLIRADGLQLSGGQKQRVAIARAVIRNPLLVIFDEATSALDTKHEGDVQKAIDAASKNVTTITIAHRLSTIRNADRIIVLDAGRIVEQGTPDYLMANESGHFFRMYTDQRLDALSRVPPISLASTSGIMLTSAKSSANPLLVGKFSMGPGDHMDIESRRRAWARSSLGASKKLGKSYSVLSDRNARAKMLLPVMSKKRSTLGTSFKATNVMEVPVEEKTFDDDMSLPGKSTSFGALWRLLREHREGYKYLACAIPITIFRGIFFLLVCFEVASVLEIATVPPDEMSRRVFIVAAAYTALIIIKTMFESVGRLFVALYGHGFCTFLRAQMFRKLLRHGMAYFDEERNAPGRLVHKLISDTNSLNRIVGDKLDLLLPAVVCSVCSVSSALLINWKLALLCGFQFPAFFMFRLVELRETSKRQRQMAEEEKKAANLAIIVLSNMSTIKAYTLQKHFDSVFCNALRPLRAAMQRQSVISAFVFACQFSFAYIFIAVTLYFGKMMMLSNEITPFDYLRVVLLTQFGANFISQLIASVADITRARVAAENIIGVINEPAVDMDNLIDEGFRPKVLGRVALKHVEFRYPSRPVVSVLNDLSLQIAPGQSLAIVGPSGSGKSSIIGLLQRIYSPTKGQVILDNTNVRSINPAYLRRVVVSVSQEPSLFSFTIKENIAFGLADDEVTMPKIIEAAKIANIHDFIVSLPKGYYTKVGEFGHQLSGGQKQRIAIARAIVRKPVVLLLDEATAALDATSEKAVQKALETISKNCTTIHVSHRLSAIRKVDRIIVLVDGKIVEQGTHQELMEDKGLYYEMNQLEK